MDESEKIRYQEAFVIIDERQSGFITVDDFHFLIRALGFTATENDLKKIDEQLIDRKEIDYLLFIDIMSKISCTKYSYEQIEEALFAFDQNRYGLINLKTFQTAMMSLGEPLTEIEMNEMLKDLPVDEDGFIEYEKFCLQFKPKDDELALKMKTTDEKAE